MSLILCSRFNATTATITQICHVAVYNASQLTAEIKSLNRQSSHASAANKYPSIL